MNRHKRRKKGDSPPPKGLELSPEQQQRLHGIVLDAQERLRAGMQAVQDFQDDHQRGLDRVAQTVESIEPTSHSNHPVKVRHVLLAFVSAAVSIGLLEAIIHRTTWPGAQWVRTHPSSLRLQLALDFVVLMVFLSIFVRRWRGTCWSIGIIGAAIAVLTII